MQKLVTLFISFLILCSLGQSQEILKAKSIKRGAYKTYQEFLDNEPSISDSIKIKVKPRVNKNWTGTSTYVLRNYSSNKKLKKIWGFSDGKKAYILHQNEFFEVFLEDSSHYFIGYDIIDNSQIGTAVIIGGAIGGGIQSAAALNKARNNPTKYLINKINGAAIHPNKKPKEINYSQYSKTIVFYRGKTQESYLPFIFSINDSVQYSLKPQVYLNIDVNIQSAIVKVCYGDSLKECNEIDFFDERLKYIDCSVTKKEKTHTIRIVSKSQGESDSYWSKKAQEKMEKPGEIMLK